MPDAVACQHCRADRRSLFDANADGHQRLDALAGREGKDARNRIEIGPGLDTHHLVAESAGIDMHRHLPGIFGERRDLHLHTLVEHGGRAGRQAGMGGGLFILSQ